MSAERKAQRTPESRPSSLDLIESALAAQGTGYRMLTPGYRLDYRTLFTQRHSDLAPRVTSQDRVGRVAIEAQLRTPTSGTDPTTFRLRMAHLLPKASGKHSGDYKMVHVTANGNLLVAKRYTGIWVPSPDVPLEDAISAALRVNIIHGYTESPIEPAPFDPNDEVKLKTRETIADIKREVGSGKIIRQPEIVIDGLKTPNNLVFQMDNEDAALAAFMTDSFAFLRNIL